METENLLNNPLKNSLKQDIIEQFGTPCAVIDLDVVDRNIAHLQNLCDAANLANRPVGKIGSVAQILKMRDVPVDDIQINDGARRAKLFNDVLFQRIFQWVIQQVFCFHDDRCL